MKRNDLDYYKELVLNEIPKEPCGMHHMDIACSIGMRGADTREIIRLLRNDGYPICSNPNDGYWMARNSSEIQEVISMFTSYINSMTHTVEALTEAKISKLKEEGDYSE